MSPTEDRSRSLSQEGFRGTQPGAASTTETEPLLGTSSSAHRSKPPKKKWYRARPLWLAPFAITASLCRGMTLAPRTEVFIQLACEDVWQSRYPHHRHTHTLPSIDISSLPFSIYSDIDDSLPFTLLKASAVLIPSIELPPPSNNSLPEGSSTGNDAPWDDAKPIDCLAEPSVQASAAKLQTMMTTTMGILSALTTGWWGQFGDRHGRTRVITCAVLGLLFTDLMFVMASNPPALLRGRAHQLLMLAPVVEGLLGGWSTLQGATLAYISDCTSHGSRAHIFSRFTGVFYIGFAMGPEIAAIILRTVHTTTAVFYFSSLCASINIFLLLFVFPESLSPEARTRNIEAAQEARTKALQTAEGKKGLWRSVKFSVKGFFEPLRILGPRSRQHGRGQDWSLTLLAMAVFIFQLTVGFFQIKYLYAKHMFSWDAETLSYYITSVGSVRAVYLLLLLPTIIRALKPAPKPAPNHNQTAQPVTTQRPNVKQTPKALVSEIKFDLMVAKTSALLDTISHSLVVLLTSSSQPLFVGSTLLSSLGAGLVPAAQSIAMCTLHLRAIDVGKVPTESKGGGESGKLFGALAVMQAIGSMILGPMLFGTVYSVTVAAYPKAIFVVATGLMIISLTLLLLIRPPRVDVPIEIRVETQVEVDTPRDRGRSRRSKDLRPVIQSDAVA